MLGEDCHCALSRQGAFLQRTHLRLPSGMAIPLRNGTVCVIPRRHVIDYWGLASTERHACHEILVQMRDQILASDTSRGRIQHRWQMLGEGCLGRLSSTATFT